MKMLSNGIGQVVVENGEAVGWRDGQKIGCLPLPLSREDANMMVALCTKQDGEVCNFGVTAENFILYDLMQSSYIVQ